MGFSKRLGALGGENYGEICLNFCSVAMVLVKFKNLLCST